ncbi:arsenate reductase (glutaredoxin) [soil metagenome]
MSAVTIYHNPNCGSSKNAVKIAEELGADVEIVQYLKHPLDEAALRDVLGKLEDPATDLVRRDSHWDKLGLADADAATDHQIVALLVEHPRLMQRPLVVTPERALIGRPKDRVTDLLAG